MLKSIVLSSGSIRDIVKNFNNSEKDLVFMEDICYTLKDAENSNNNLENGVETNGNGASVLNTNQDVNLITSPISVVDSQKGDENKLEHVNNKDLEKPFQCPLCEVRYTSKAARCRHLTKTHSIDRNHIHKCLDCLLVFVTREGLRRHLQDNHGLDMSPVCLYFKNMEEFYTWKSNMERETLAKYHKKVRLKSKSSSSFTSFKYYCSRSGRLYNYRTKKDTKKYRLSRIKDTIKLGITCTAEIHAQFIGNEVDVKYYPVHYGHGKDKLIKQLSPEEQSAVDELAEKGFNSEKLLEELSSKKSVDVTHMYPTRRRYLSWVKNAYKAEEYNTEMSDLECVSNWVKQCSDMEECPVLFCLQENIATKKELFILVIMTEFQKQILTSASKQVICVDVINRISDAHLVTVLVIDELQTAFPVAYCLSSKLNKDVIKQFFTCIKEYAGTLSPEYLMTNHNLLYFESWVEVMNNSPQWLWSRWDTEGSFVDHLRLFVKKNMPKKRELYNIFQTILDCNSKDVVIHMFKSFVDKIQQDEKYKKLGEWAVKRLGSDIEKWATCFQKEVDTSIILHLEIMHHVFYTCGILGKGKRLYSFLSCIMKVLRYKILDRILNSFDDEKISLAEEAIDFCHAKGLAFPPEKIFSLSNNLWMIDELNKVYVTQDMDKCPDHCNLRCKQCEICVHQFSCSCINNMIDANLCLHIHAIVYKFLQPNKFQHASSDKLSDLEANNSNSEGHTLDSMLLEPCAVSEVVESPADFSPSQATNSISVERSTAKDIPIQPQIQFIPISSQVSTPHHIQKLVSRELNNENVSTFMRIAKSKNQSVQNLRSILKKYNKSTSETTLKKTTMIPQSSNKSTFEKMLTEKTIKVPRVIFENATISHKMEETKNMAFNKTTLLSQILQNHKLSKDSLITINKCLDECISTAILNP